LVVRCSISIIVVILSESEKALLQLGFFYCYHQVKKIRS
jgi:hypothetical protein